ncbi:MAG: hypothetical protein M3R55_10805, partial [Acidobacteriota bacterium]|nr:hypothetical protein [Acidobacteriota bacterium]
AGGAWTDATPALVKAGAIEDRYVSRVFASPHEAGTAFVAKSGFRNDDFRAFLYRTTDFGETWTSIGHGLPGSPINVVVQDRINRHLLIVGNDLGVWVSNDAGAAWSRLKANLPTVAVHDLTVHPRENDLVLGTYGRGIWIGDITALQQARPSALAAAAHAFEIEPRARYAFGAIGNYDLFGDKYIQVPNEPDALVIRYWLREKASTPAKITIADASGAVINELTGPGEAGLNQVQWNMRPAPPAGDSARRFGGPPAVAPGNYQVRIDVAGQTFTKVGTIRPRL